MKLELRSLIIVLSVCFALHSGSLAESFDAPSPQPGIIVGTVLDGSGAVVQNATVLLESIDQHQLATTVSQENGFFSLPNLPPGTPYIVVVKAHGFADWRSGEIHLSPSQSFILTGVSLKVAVVETAVTAVLPEEVAAEQVKAEEKQRILGLIPNFYVAYQANAAPLTTKLKFQLALKAITDPVTITGFAMNAAIYQAADYPGYQQGAKGYGQRLGATFAGGYTNIIVGNAILPSLLHQDPRYFYQGSGTTKSRLLHAIATPFITRGDNGRSEINFSNIGGDLASGAIANAYYPKGDRSAARVFDGALIGVGGRMIEGVLQEFVLRKHTRIQTEP